jgi:hypothetical protein
MWTDYTENYRESFVDLIIETVSLSHHNSHLRMVYGISGMHYAYGRIVRLLPLD